MDPKKRLKLKIMRDLVIMIVVFLVVWEVFIGGQPKHVEKEEPKFNGADTLKIMIHNDSITSIKTLK
jgi:hypothetical protein